MRRALLIAAFAIASFTSSAMAANADFVLVNKTGYDINEVFISPTNKQNWGNDRLGAYQLTNNDSVTMRFGDTKNCHQDIKVIFTDDESEVEWDNFNLCEINQIILKYNRKTDEVSAEYN